MNTNFSILQGVGAPVFAVESAGNPRILAWNPKMAQLSGVAAKAAVGALVEDVLGPDFLRVLGKTRQETDTIAGLGSVLVSHQSDHILCTVTDHEREAFLSMAAHDLKSPLRNVLFLAEEISFDPSSADTMLARIKQTARNGILLSNDVLACAQSNALAKTKPRTTRLKDLCQAILKTWGGAEVCKLSCTDVRLLIERPMLNAALRNLIDNAMRHAGIEALCIEVAARAVEQGVQITVTDNGIGFSDAQRAFLNGGEFRVESGFGLLGLRRLLHARGGRLSVASNPKGTGSVVSLTLPGKLLEGDQIAIAS